MKYFWGGTCGELDLRAGRGSNSGSACSRLHVVVQLVLEAAWNPYVCNRTVSAATWHLGKVSSCDPQVSARAQLRDWEWEGLITLLENIQPLVGGRRSHMLGAWLVLQLSGLLRLQNVHRARIVKAKVSKVQASRLAKLQSLVSGVMRLRISHKGSAAHLTVSLLQQHPEWRH